MGSAIHSFGCLRKDDGTALQVFVDQRLVNNSRNFVRTLSKVTLVLHAHRYPACKKDMNLPKNPDPIPNISRVITLKAKKKRPFQQKPAHQTIARPTSTGCRPEKFDERNI